MEKHKSDKQIELCYSCMNVCLIIIIIIIIVWSEWAEELMKNEEKIHKCLCNVSHFIRYACQVCNHVSRSKDALRKHVSYRHPGTSTCDPDSRRKRSRLNPIPIPLTPGAQASMLLSQANIQANLFGPMMSPTEAAHFVKQEIIKEPPLHHTPTAQPQPPQSPSHLNLQTVPPTSSPKPEKMQTAETNNNNSSNGEIPVGNNNQQQ